MHKSFENAEAAPLPAEAEAFREKAARCRRLAISIADSRTAESLMALAEEYEREAYGLTAKPQDA